MSVIYVILGIIGWTAAAIVVPLYVVASRRANARASDVTKVEG